MPSLNFFSAHLFETKVVVFIVLMIIGLIKVFVDPEGDKEEDNG